MTATRSSSLAFERVRLGLALGVPLLLVPGLRLKPDGGSAVSGGRGGTPTLAISALIRTGGGF
ncbi:hypothetical protein [Ralstonia solanacearum]|uniref:hypothetical protein n=1 Tax=Ralstonia solanacearum TaxID=305 RepID=UPI000504C2E3|nr:hypothetical protein [Ralstonia solanacearum]KFX28086.1 hypothetical protein KR96_15160 [Ralstonia solanacearum]